MLFKSAISQTNDFVPQFERKTTLRNSLKLGRGIIVEEKLISFFRGNEQIQLNLAKYPKQGLLLQALREEFQDESLSYFYDPTNKKEIDYNGLWDYKHGKILVMGDSDDVNYVLKCFERNNCQ